MTLMKPEDVEVFHDLNTEFRKVAGEKLSRWLELTHDTVNFSFFIDRLYFEGDFVVFTIIAYNKKGQEGKPEKGILPSSCLWDPEWEKTYQPHTQAPSPAPMDQELYRQLDGHDPRGNEA